MTRVLRRFRVPWASVLACPCLRGTGLRRAQSSRVSPVMFFFFTINLASLAHAAWPDPPGPFRRSIDVEWAAERGTGEQLATAEIYTGGHHQPSGENIRVATEEGKFLPSRVLMIGPGDKLRILFALQPNSKCY